MKLTEIRVIKSHRGMRVGEVLNVRPELAEALVEQGRFELVNAAPVAAPIVEPPPAPKPAEKPAAKKPAAKKPAEDEKSKPKGGRAYNRRDMKAKP